MTTTTFQDNAVLHHMMDGLLPMTMPRTITKDTSNWDKLFFHLEYLKSEFENNSDWVVTLKE